MMNASWCQMLQPTLAVPWGQKKPQLVVLDTSHHHPRRLPVPKAQLKTSSADHDKFRGTVKPWYSLFGMSAADVYREFPETLWNVYGDSLETLRKKDREPNQNRWSTDAEFDSGFAESIAFDRNLYKYAILGCKTNVDRIMNGGALSSCELEKITQCLESIEDDIEQGKFEWKEGVDIHTNVVEALSDKFGVIPKDLLITNKYESCLLILEMWGKGYIDQISTEMKKLQVALVLFTLRIDCVLHYRSRQVQHNTFLKSLVLPSLKMLERDASDLRAFLGLIYSSSEGVISLRNRFPEFSLSKRSIIAYLARSISYCIPDHLVQVLDNFISSHTLISIRPHGEVVKYWGVIKKINIDEPIRERERRHLALSKCLNIGDGEFPKDCEIQDAKYQLFSTVKSVLELINQSIHCVENMTVDLKKVQISHPKGYDNVLGFAHFLITKGIALETAYAVIHLCLEKQVQPSELSLQELAHIDFPRDRAHVVLHDKGSVFGKFTRQDRDSCKKLIKWCCKLHVNPDTIFERYIMYF